MNICLNLTQTRANFAPGDKEVKTKCTVGWVIFWDSSFSQLGNCQMGSNNQKVVFAN